MSGKTNKKVNKRAKPRNSNAKKTVKREKDVINLKNIPAEEIVFALDIGTRSVVGIVGVQVGTKFSVMDVEIIGHKQRSMIDGQIHNIEQVAEVVQEVKDRMEKRLGINLKKVSIAAAGRVLKTCEAKTEMEIDSDIEIEHDLVKGIELEALQQAQIILDNEVRRTEKTQYYCVGYSVKNYYLNDYVISSPVGHKGRKIGVELLATFLPHTVVSSLYSVVEKADLEVANLTLEPIAAINVTISKDLRLLNLALVDIGAGTSDIAITKDGCIVAFAMVPIAGDEVTEAISKNYLVDFNTAEKIKISASTGKEKIQFVDIMGNKNSVSSAEIFEVIKNPVEILAKEISEKIIEYNGKSPSGIFLVGGGSQVPGLSEGLASKLSLSKDRIAIRNRKGISNVGVNFTKLNGPEAITPIGIAVTAQMQKKHNFVEVWVNDKKIQMYNSQKLTAIEALALAGVSPNDLIARSGKSVTFILNGQERKIKGDYGKVAQIYINGKVASIESPLNSNDRIVIEPAVNGEDADIRVSDIISTKKTGKIRFNDEVFDIGVKVHKNGRLVDWQSKIEDGDHIEVNEILFLKDLLSLCEMDIRQIDVLVNDKKVGVNYELQGSDIVTWNKKTIEFKDPILKENYEKESCENVAEACREDNFIDVIVNGERKVIEKKNTNVVFVDIFNYIDFDLKRRKGDVVLKLNGKKAKYMDVLKSGDIIDIYWD